MINTSECSDSTGRFREKGQKERAANARSRSTFTRAYVNMDMKIFGRPHSSPNSEGIPNSGINPNHLIVATESLILA